MKTEIKKKEIIKISVIAVFALALLFAVYKVFFVETSDLKSGYTQEEARLCNILSEIEGVGKVSVIINSEKECVGVVVVCEGADDLLVRSEILQAVRIATGAGTNDIMIYKKSE